MEQSKSEEAKKMLDFYIHDYLVKRELPISSDYLKTEAEVDLNIADKIEKPRGFLSEWWLSTYWHHARIHTKARNFEALVREQTPQMLRQPLPPNRASIDWERIRHSVSRPSGGGMRLKEAGRIPTGNILTCCNYSSDGKVLAIGGDDKKVHLLDTGTHFKRDFVQDGQEHTINDICFRPNSTQLMTASTDGSVRHWETKNFCKLLGIYTDNTSRVSSLDINPATSNVSCFSDSKDTIHYCTLNPFLITGKFEQKGVGQVRFQPTGKLLAAASHNGFSVIDYKHEKQICFFEGNVGSVPNVCWHPDGDLLASVTDRTIKVWSLSSNKCIRDLESNGNYAHSCIFHPTDPCVLVAGRSPDLELWHILQNKSTTVPANIDRIFSLSRSPATGMIASMSFDGMVKMWETIY